MLASRGPNGCLLSVVLGADGDSAAVAERLAPMRPTFREAGGELADRMAAAAAPGIGMLIYSAYIYCLTGNPLQWAAQNAAWGRVYRGLDVLVSEQRQIIGRARPLQLRLDPRPRHAYVDRACSSCSPPCGRSTAASVLPYAAMILVNMLPPLADGRPALDGPRDRRCCFRRSLARRRRSGAASHGLARRLRDAAGALRHRVLHMAAAILSLGTSCA